MDQAFETEPGKKEIRRRNQNACDACRSRKVKCLYDGPVCRACIELQVLCTQNRPRKRRGPPNSYAAALRRETIASPTSISVNSPSTTSGSPSQPPIDVLGQLASPSVIQAMIDDWFESLHSVAPILHRGQFLSRLENGDTLHDLEFCALVISICAATVTSLRRKASTKYDFVTVERCCEVINQNRLLERKPKITLEWTQTNYNLGVTCYAERGLGDLGGFRYISDSVMGVKYLLYYEMQAMSFTSQQLLKRLYWLLFVGNCSEMFGRPCVGLFSPLDNIEALRPLDITDADLDPTFSSQDTTWQTDAITYIPGLNYLSNLFLIWQSSQQSNNNTIPHLQHHIHLIQRSLDTLPTPLRWRGGLSRPPQSNFGTDVQIANLYITQLHIRSNLLEQCHRLSTSLSSPKNQLTSQQIVEERQGIVDDLLEILDHMPRETLEANGRSLVPKIRDIGSALLDAGEGVGVGAVSEKAKADLVRLLDRLDKLDFQVNPKIQFAGGAVCN